MCVCLPDLALHVASWESERASVIHLFGWERVSGTGCTSTPQPPGDGIRTSLTRCWHLTRIAQGGMSAKLPRTCRRCPDTLGQKWVWNSQMRDALGSSQPGEQWKEPSEGSGWLRFCVPTLLCRCNGGPILGLPGSSLNIHTTHCGNPPCPYPREQCGKMLYGYQLLTS